jgi:hypothetical protein
MTRGKGRAGLTAVAALACGMGFGSIASAADLGGNCCADLEERVAELEATTARKGTRKVSLEISGWLNKSLLFWDDSVRNDVYSVDNDAAQSRWRFTGSAVINPDLRAGFVYEFGGHGSQTSWVNQTNGGDDLGFSGARLRQANAWLESKRFGRVTIGVASQATDGIAEIDLSRTEVVSGSNVSAWNASFFTHFRVGGFQSYYFPMIEHFGGNFDGGRDQLIRWDSPTIGGFQLAASISPGREYVTVGIVTDYVEWDVALRYAAEFNGWRFAAGIGYHQGIIRDSEAGAPEITSPGCPSGICLPGSGALVSLNWEVPVNTVVGSAAMLHVPSGFFFTFAAGQASFDSSTLFDGDKYSYLYAKSGFLRSWLPFGQTSIYGEYYQYRYSFGGGNGYDFLETSFTSHVWGAGIVQHIDAAAMELYLAYRYYDSPDRTFGILNLDFGDFHMVQTGMRIRF